MNRAVPLTLVAGMAFGLAACSADRDESATAPLTEPVAAAEQADAGHASPIAWYDGTVDAAFARAQQTDKPLFLYWGAEWCPPCHLVKATVFRSREFIERSRLFVPVYLDGDTPNAQSWGEKFNVLGYPTMIVFSAAGEEITRIPGGSDVQAYANILDLSLNSSTAVASLLTDVMDERRELSAAECGLLAGYSWGQDTVLLEGRDRTVVFKTLFETCPDTQTRWKSVLYLAYLNAAIEAANAAEDPVPLTVVQQSQAASRLGKIVSDAALTRANLYDVMLGGADLIRAVTRAGSPEREALSSQFANAYRRIAANEDIYRGERLYAYVGLLNLERLEDQERPVSDGLRAQIAAAVAEADGAITDVYVRQSVMNTASNVLVAAGMLDEARVLLNKEIGISKQPYYFMVSLADIEQESGNHTDAIGWLRRAYDVSTGPATRFQWGYYYISGLIDMAPEEEAMIQAAVGQVFDELGAARAFYQRPKKQMERLQTKLREWNSDNQHASAMTAIRERVMQVCVGIPDAEPARQTCERFLASQTT